MSAHPVAYLVFNRPHQTTISFDAIRARRPPRLFVIADGPRADHREDATRCEQVRAIVASIDWPCDVSRLYAADNLGCKARVSSGLTWVFAQVESAIIIEDDCVPHPDFFTFCEALLDRYSADDRVWHITGGQYCDTRADAESSYYFSKYPHSWGWATWRRAWSFYDGAISFWPVWRRSSHWLELMPDPVERKYWTRIFDKVYAGKVDSWDYPWIASVWYHGGSAAAPAVNLIQNIGIGADATHTNTQQDHPGPPIRPLGNLRHPDHVSCDAAADRFEFYHSSWGAEIQKRRTPAGFARAAARRLLRLLPQRGRT